jgi:oligosaccharide repeat unit polymerase
VDPKLVAVGLSLLILAQAYAVKRSVGTWIFPACLFGLFWFLLTFFPLVMLYEVPIDPYAVGYLLLCCIAFSCGALWFNWPLAFAENARKARPSDTYGSRFLVRAFLASTLSAGVLVIANSLAQGVTLRDLVFNLFLSAQLYADLRYSEGLEGTTIERLSIVCAYLGAILGGLRVSCAGRKKLVVLLAFLPSVLIAIAQSARWHLMLSVALFYAGLLVYRVASGQFKLLQGRLVSLAVPAAILLSIISVSFLAKGIASDLLSYYFASYSSGHLYAFSDWYAFTLGHHSQLGYAAAEPSYGFYTFATLFKLAGSQRVLPLGVYEDVYFYGEVLSSNVYTMFRGLILDFGIVGSLVFMSAVGTMFHGAFRGLLSARRPVFTVAVFIFMVGFFFSSFTVSMFGTNIIYYVTFVLLCAILWANGQLTHRAHADDVDAQRLTAGSALALGLSPFEPEASP